MPKIVILGSCRFEPYEVLMTPNKLDKNLYAKNHEKAYKQACKKFYPAIQQADIVIVYDPDGVGEHTQKDIDFARSHGKEVIYLYGRLDNVIESTAKQEEKPK